MNAKYGRTHWSGNLYFRSINFIITYHVEKEIIEFVVYHFGYNLGMVVYKTVTYTKYDEKE